MARKSTQLFRTVQIIILAIGGLLLSLNVAIATSPNADNLIQEGFGQFYAGQFNAALKTWRQAETIYRHQGNSIGVSGSLVNQSLAQQAIGQDLTACYSAADALILDHKLCRGQGSTDSLSKLPNQPTTMLGLKTLGDSLNGLGYWEIAETVLKQALQQENRAELWNSLGNVYAQSKQVDKAISAYKMAIQLAQQNQQKTALMNAQISLLELQALDITAVPTIDLSELPGILKAQAHLKIAHSVLKQQPLISLQQAQTARSIGQHFHHPRTEVEALGLIAKIQDQLGHPDLQLVHQAISGAQSIRAWDLAFPSQVLLAKMHLAKNQPQQAIQFYRSAIHNLSQVQQQLQGTSNNRQFDFQKEVESIYQQYLELLFDNADNANEIIRTSSQLQITELENFLGCQLEDWKRIEQVQQTDDSTLIFVVRGTDRYHVIVRSNNQPDYRYSIPAKALESIAHNLITNIQTGQLSTTSSDTILNYGKSLYDALLRPAAAKLPKTGTFVFVLDAALQNLPLDFLHDGQDYLLRKYNLSVTLGAQLRQPKPLSSNQFKVLLAGISEAAPSFGTQLNVLTQTKNELTGIQQNVKSKLLLNQDFTIERFKQTLNEGQYPIVHISTHGTFSSDPKSTGLLAWDRTLNLPELRNLIKQQSQKQHSIELLVLSACETADGDQRSVLGLAGVAAQAGARSTVASLWRVDESATAALMELFYSGLRAGLPKADALRQAKLALLDSEQFTHPFFWGGFILVGSWL